MLRLFIVFANVLSLRYAASMLHLFEDLLDVFIPYRISLTVYGYLLIKGPLPVIS